MSVKSVIIRRQKPIQRSRPGVATIVDGKGHKPTPTTTTIQAHVQPLNPKQIRDLPPGQNAIDWRNVWTVEPSDILINDVITTGGISYRLKSAIFWEEGEFYQAQGSKVSDTLP
jgi:hypothetical protein